MESINRRTFMGNIGVGTVGTAGALACPVASMQAAKTDLGRILPLSETKEPLNHRSAKIKVKPVSSFVIHDGVWTGPLNLANVGETKVTIARFDPLISKLLVIGGEITGCEGQNEAGCSLRAHVRVANPDSLVREARNYGFHFAMVYGDYIQDLQELGEMLKIRIEAHQA